MKKNDKEIKEIIGRLGGDLGKLAEILPAHLTAMMEKMPESERDMIKSQLDNANMDIDKALGDLTQAKNNYETLKKNL